MADWRPDWRDLSNYPLGEKMENRWWAWQFARRNRGYEAAWIPERDEYEEAMEFVSQGVGREVPRDVTGLPGREWSETWGFSRPLDPAVETPPPSVEFNGRVVAIPGGRVSSLRFLWSRFQLPPKLMDDQSRWIAYLDFSRELDPQIEEIRESAKREQQRLEDKGAVERRIKKTHSKQWAFHLCLLDADFDGQSPRDIADHFIEDPIDRRRTLDEKRVGTRLKKALELTEPEGYLWEFFGLT